MIPTKKANSLYRDTTKKHLEALIYKYKDKFEINSYCGIPISELTIDELRALVCNLNDEIETSKRNHIHDLQMLG